MLWSRWAVTYEQILLIDHCVALRNIGEYKKVLEQLEALNIDRYAGVLPITKVIYYNNLADIHLCVHALEKAEIWYNKSLMLLNDLKDEKQKRMVATILAHNAAEIAYYKQDYDRSFEILNGLAETNMRDAVYKALLYAKNDIAQGKIAEAKSRLQFVVENGNRLIDVQIAKDLLANM